MRVFISWSGPTSHQVAVALHDWLPTVIQALQPWVSSKDVDKGDSWLTSIRDSLVKAEGMGIFCLTADNLAAPWMLFEAGAVSSADRSRVATFLWNVEPSGLKPPLSLFQATLSHDQADVLRLLAVLNARLPTPLSSQRLERAFQKNWPELENSLGAIDAPSAVLQESAPSVDHLLEEVLAVVRRLESDGEETRRSLRTVLHITRGRFDKSQGTIEAARGDGGALSSVEDFMQSVRDVQEGDQKKAPEFAKMALQGHSPRVVVKRTRLHKIEPSST